MDEENFEVKKENLTEYDKAVKEFLNQSINFESQGSDVEKIASNSSFDRNNEILLKYYNEKTGNDFQEGLREELGIKVAEKLKKKLDNKKINDKQKEEQIRDMSREAFEEEQVDKDIQERVIKKVEKENDLSQKEVDFKAELMKGVYEEAYERYSSILEKYKRQQLREESMSIGDKEGTELVLYEKYLSNIEKKYSSYAKSKGLEENHIEDDKNIKEIKEKLRTNMKSMTRSNDEHIEDNIQRIKILSDRRNAIAEKMVEISENRDNMSPANFKATMDYYQQQYFAITVEMRSQDPTLEMYQQQLMQENENIDYSNRTIGGRNDNIVAGSYQEIDSYGNEKEDLGDQNVKAINEITQDYSTSVETNVDDLIVEAQEAVNSGDLEHAIEVIESAEAITFGYEISAKDQAENETNPTDDQAKEQIDKNKDKDSEKEENSNSFMQEMESGVANEREARLQERIRILKEENNKNKEEMEVQQGNLEQVKVRSRFGKKN